MSQFSLPAIIDRNIPPQIASARRAAYQVLAAVILIGAGGWVEFEKEIPITPGATNVQLQAGLFGYTGTFDLADVKVFTE